MGKLLDNVKHRKNFYINAYRGSLTALIVFLSIIIILLLLNLYYFVYANRTDVSYYATSVDGEIFPLKASEVPPPYADFTNIIEY